MIKSIAITSVLLIGSVHSSYAESRSNVLKQRECISRIVYSESRGEPKSGQLAIAHASINRAIKTTGNTCTIKGVSRLSVPKDDRPYFNEIAEFALFHKSSVAQADSWNRGKMPAYKGKIVRKISKHLFYIMAQL
jgi:hypothetical protein